MDENITKKIKTKDGRLVTLALDECMMEISAKTEHEEVIGSFGFREIETDSENYLLVCSMDLSGIKSSFERQGIGREILAFAIEYWDLTIIARSEDGMRRDDGSHLTGNAPAFVNAMLIEGKLTPANADQREFLEGHFKNHVQESPDNDI